MSAGITGSALERVYNCPGSTALPQANSTTEASTQGNTNHTIIEVGLATGNYAGLPDVARGMMGDGVTVRVEVAYALDLEKRTVRCLGERIGRNYGELCEWEIALTVDAIFTGPGGTCVVDWKSRERTTVATANWQLRTGCLAVLTEMGLTETDGAIAYLDDGFIDPMMLDVFQATALWGDLRHLVAQAKRAQKAAADGLPVSVHSGSWCRYCPAFVHCPAQTKLALAMLGEASDLAVATMSDEQAGRAWEKLKEIQAIAGKIEDALRTRAKRTSLPLSNGKRLALVSSSRRSVDTKGAVKLLEEAGIAVPYKTSTFDVVKEIKGIGLALVGATEEDGDAA